MASLGWVFFNIGKINFYLFVIYNVRRHQKYQKCTFLMVLNVSYQGEIVFRKKYVYWIYLADTNNLSQKKQNIFPFWQKHEKSQLFGDLTLSGGIYFLYFFNFYGFWVCVVEGICLFSTSKILTLRAVMDTEPIQRGSKFAKNQLPKVLLNWGGVPFSCHINNKL